MPTAQADPVDINEFHIAHANAHEGALRKTAKQMGVTLVGILHECKGYLLAKGIRISIPSKTSNRAVKRLGRVFVNLGGKKHVMSAGGKRYPVIIKDDYSRYAWMYFISHKSDATDAFARFLSDLRLEGVPPEVVVVRLDDGGEFSEGKFGRLCRDRNIKQEFTTSRQPRRQWCRRTRIGRDRVCFAGCLNPSFSAVPWV